MNMPKCLLLSVIFLMASCGGSGGASDTPSRFDGVWRGELTGIDCAGNQVTKSFEHRVDAESDELNAAVTLVDQDGNTYHGNIDGTASVSGTRYGFSCESPDKQNSIIDYNILLTPDGVANVYEIINVPQDGGCEYALNGTATRETP